MAPVPECSAARRPAATLASATGIRLRGFHSNSSNSTASSTAATGEAKVADMPAAAPATSSVLRSVALSRNNCAIMEPNAPPVMMMGPSAPNGPPEPMEMALERGLRMRDLGLHFAAVDQDGFDGFRDAVAADALRAVSRHDSDDESAHHRHRRLPKGPDDFRPAIPWPCPIVERKTGW